MVGGRVVHTYMTNRGRRKGNLNWFAMSLKAAKKERKKGKNVYDIQ